MASKETTEDQYYSCPECQVGIMDLDYITYLTHRGGDLIAVPNFPAWICDVCGRRAYDPQAISWLNILLNANPNRQRARRRGSHAPAEKPSPPTVSE